ncbi:MAG: cyclic pyranopterin monophosphate synthase MoaC [Candidatus Helarchaeota archaeon]
MRTSRTSMIDISEKKDILRVARARGTIFLEKETINTIKENKIKKGDVLANAELAAVNAVKQTPAFIFLAHPIPIMSVDVSFEIEEKFINVFVEVKAIAKTGVELEALMGVEIALLTIWDMTKYLEKDENGQYPNTKISDILVIEKIKQDL